MSTRTSHLMRVRALYKAILKLHRGLPLQMKALGDQYVKEEFRAHKNAEPPEVAVFMQEWTKYYVTLAQQLSQRKREQIVGENLSPEMLDNFREEQLGQLHELFKETTQPKDTAEKTPQS
ncbi:succinate dehydrogenase assembly factor 3, mitochondrial [Plakobranchus ocellatus]|uniref:Succinate dehydrogenase assembly factor 3 n=1 Tax=Plakobranchus ocellatus TaxID=259542 RepID=A0AAV3ZEB9_9GAST|nr:succinate dehydrogenase assembly factor 3, mitochondrial [Plakobranchus ocellatus]